MLRNVLTACLLATISLATLTTTVTAQRPTTATLVPDTTKGFLASDDVDLLIEKFNASQLGELVNDPVMKPFVDDLKRQINNKLLKTGVRLGLTWEDLKEVYGGEVCLAAIQPPMKEVAGAAKPKKVPTNNQHAMALVVDITGHEKQATELLEKVSKNLTNKGGVKKRYRVPMVNEGDDIIVVYEMPEKNPSGADNICYATVDKFLIAADHLQTAMQIMRAASGNGDKSLADTEHYSAVLKRVHTEAAGLAPHARWFIEPLGYAQVSRAANGGKKKRGTDILKVLANQGFTAIQGVGGYVNFSTEKQHEMLHKSFIYAPPVDRAVGDNSKDRYNLAARMLDFPNSINKDSLKAQDWIPRAAATYMSFNWKMKAAFEYSSTLVDELAGNEGTFESVIEGLREDVPGPLVDLRKDLVDHFAERATLLTDYRVPITPKSERMMFAVELKNADAVTKSLKKIMKNERKAKPVEFKDHTIWEIINNKNVKDDVASDLKIDGPGIGFPGGIEEEEEEDGLNIEGPGFGTFSTPVSTDTLALQPGPRGPGNGPGGKGAKEKKFPNWAVTVAHGHLIAATHVDFIKDMLTVAGPNNNLSMAADYQLINAELVKLGAELDSFRSFSRTDEANRPTYELLKQGKMPQSETLFGKMLNRLFETEDQEGLRKQQIDGTKLPEYGVVRHHLGPAGLYVQSEDQGWIIVGCLMHKSPQKKTLPKK